MVRFYLASIFPRVPRLLYLDNDVIVGCCLEEIWGTDLGEHNIAGLALDDLKWAAASKTYTCQYLMNIKVQYADTDLLICLLL